MEAAVHGVADALTYATADDVERAWINHVADGVATRDLQRRRWLIENLVSGFGGAMTWKD